MDRRAFMTTASAAAMASSVSSAQQSAAEASPGIQAPAAELTAAPLIPARLELTVGVLEIAGMPGDAEAVTGLARHLETLSDGRIRLTSVEMATGGIEAVMTGATDLYYATEHDNVAWHPALEVFGGLPSPVGLSPDAFFAWMKAGGGDMLWDDLAADFNVKPLLAGLEAAPLLLWSRDDGVPVLNGLHISGGAPSIRSGLAAAGARPVTLPRASEPAALARGDIDAVVQHDPTMAGASGLIGGCRSITAFDYLGGTATRTLGIRRSLWERLTLRDQTLLSLVADRAVMTRYAGSIASHRPSLDAITGHRSGPVRQATVDRDAADLVAIGITQSISATLSSDARAERIGASLAAFAEAVIGRAPATIRYESVPATS